MGIKSTRDQKVRIQNSYSPSPAAVVAGISHGSSGSPGLGATLGRDPENGKCEETNCIPMCVILYKHVWGMVMVYIIEINFASNKKYPTLGRFGRKFCPARLAGENPKEGWSWNIIDI